MNTRFVVSVVVLFFVTMLLGMVVHGILLGEGYQATGLFRGPEDAQVHFPYMLAAHLFLAIGYTWIYRRGRDERPWLGQGLRFGIAAAMLTAVPMYLIYFAVQPMPGDIVAQQIVLGTLGSLIVGMVAAAINRDPLPRPLGASGAG
jgi:hypothetical protein